MWLGTHHLLGCRSARSLPSYRARAVKSANLFAVSVTMSMRRRSFSCSSGVFTAFHIAVLPVSCRRRNTDTRDSFSACATFGLRFIAQPRGPLAVVKAPGRSKPCYRTNQAFLEFGQIR